MSKSLLKPLVAKELSHGGQKITRMGVRRRKKVMQLIADSNTASGAERKLKSEFGKKRNWKTIATTELTDAKSMASFEMIEEVFGPDTKIFRRAGEECCDACIHAFGDPRKPKIYKLSTVPAKYRGAVHPNCVCGPWQTVEMPDLTKSHSSAYPIGALVREWSETEDRWKVLLSTGRYWTDPFSTTGRYVLKYILTQIPVAKIGENNGLTILRHGAVFRDDCPFGKKCKIELFDFKKLSGVRFYASKLEADHTKVRTFDDYFNFMLEILPIVASMPEIWENGHSIRYVSDLLSYKTITDWMIVTTTPPKKPLRVFWMPETNVGRIIRQVTYRQINKTELKKCI